jgi:hypothetical protein
MHIYVQEQRKRRNCGGGGGILLGANVWKKLLLNIAIDWYVHASPPSTKRVSRSYSKNSQSIVER